VWRIARKAGRVLRDVFVSLGARGRPASLEFAKTEHRAAAERVRLDVISGGYLPASEKYLD
jgi:hypothetical protein